MLLGSVCVADMYDNARRWSRYVVMCVVVMFVMIECVCGYKCRTVVMLTASL